MKPEDANKQISLLKKPECKSRIEKKNEVGNVFFQEKYYTLLKFFFK